MFKKDKGAKMYYGGGMIDARNRSEMYMMDGGKVKMYKDGGKISKKENSMLEKHKEHHSKKHMDKMKDDMIKGDSFKASHNKALKKVGK